MYEMVLKTSRCVSAKYFAAVMDPQTLPSISLHPTCCLLYVSYSPGTCAVWFSWLQQFYQCCVPNNTPKRNPIQLYDTATLAQQIAAMPGAYELQLISRYFGGPSALRSLAGTGVRGVNKLTEDASAAVSTSAGAHPHHLHPHKPHAADKKQSSSEEELMQVLFNKLQGTKYTGPAHQGDAHGQPGH